MGRLNRDLINNIKRSKDPEVIAAKSKTLVALYEGLEESTAFDGYVNECQEHIIGVLSGFEGQISHQERMGYDTQTFIPEVDPAYIGSKLWEAHEPKDDSPSVAANSEANDRLAYLTELKEYWSDKLVEALGREPFTEQHTKIFLDRLLGSIKPVHDVITTKHLPNGDEVRLHRPMLSMRLQKGYIDEFVPANSIIGRLVRVANNISYIGEEYSGKYRLDMKPLTEEQKEEGHKKVMRCLYRLCELRHDIKEAYELETQGVDFEDDDVRIYEDDPLQHMDWRGNALSHGWDGYDGGFSEEFTDYLKSLNQRVLFEARNLREAMSKVPMINKKLQVAREVIHKLRDEKDNQGRRVLKFHEEHKLIGVALYLLAEAGAKEASRLSNVALIWSLNGSRWSKIPYGFEYGQWGRHSCTDAYLTRIEESNGVEAANEVLQSYNSYIGKMNLHWLKMENVGGHICKKLDSPENVVVRPTILTTHKKDMVLQTNGTYKPRQVDIGDYLWPEILRESYSIRKEPVKPKYLSIREVMDIIADEPDADKLAGLLCIDISLARKVAGGRFQSASDMLPYIRPEEVERLRHVWNGLSFHEDEMPRPLTDYLRHKQMEKPVAEETETFVEYDWYDEGDDTYHDDYQFELDW